MTLTELIGRQNKVALVIIGIVLLVTVVLADAHSGPAFESSVFYLLPVSFFAAFLERRTGLIVAIICAGIGLRIHRANFPDVASSVTYWNALAWLAVYVFFVFMISEIRNLYRRERARAHTDVLTGIPNRRAFFETLEVEKNRARRYGHPVTLAYIDLDHFKEVNDSLGHSTGDRLLAVVARCMKANVRHVDTVARLGGDEFAVLLPEADSAAAAAALGKLRASLDAAMEQRNWPVTFSIGGVTYDPPPDSVQEMIDAADQVMYTAKRSGKGRLVVRTAA